MNLNTLHHQAFSTSTSNQKPFSSLIKQEKHTQSPSLEITHINRVPKRPTLDRQDIVFNFVVPLPRAEEEGLVSGLKPDSLIVPLTGCNTSELFFAYAKKAWELGRRRQERGRRSRAQGALGMAAIGGLSSHGATSTFTAMLWRLSVTQRLWIVKMRIIHKG